MSARRVASLADLPGVGAIRVVIDGLPVAVVRDELGDIHAVSDTCTHAEVSLSEGEIEDCTVECWLHGSRFDLRTGKPTGPPAVQPVPVYPVTVDGQRVLVDVDAPL